MTMSFACGRGRIVLPIALVLAASGCGGGSSPAGVVTAPTSAPVQTSTPAPTPTPTPPPTPTPTPTTALLRDLSQDRMYSTMAIEFPYWTREPAIVIGGPGAVVDTYIEIAYSAAARDFIVAAPGYVTGPLRPGQLDAQTGFAMSYIRNDAAGGGSQDLLVRYRDPQFLGAAPAFDYATVGIWYGSPTQQYGWTGPVAGYDSYSIGFFTFGNATGARDMPTDGVHVYEGIVTGLMPEPRADLVPIPGKSIGGTARFTIDFGARTATGSMRLHTGDGTLHLQRPEVNLGDVTLARAFFVSDRMGFSDFTHPGSGPNRWFSAQFAGPRAKELMAVFETSVIDPSSGQPRVVFGVLVAKRM